MKISFRAELLLLFVTLIWGGTFVLIKNALGEISPFAFNMMRFGIAAIIWALLFFRTLPRNTQYVRQGVLLGVLYGMGFLLQAVGLQYTTVAKSGFITGAMVIITPFAYRLIEKKHVSLFAKIGVAVAGGGLWIFTNPSWDNINIGDVLTLISAVVWAVYLVYIDVFTRETIDQEQQRTTALVLYQLLTTCFLAGVMTLLRGEFPSVATLSMSTVLLALSYTSLLATVVATGVQTHWQRFTTPVKAALIFSLEPVFASGLGVIMLNEHLGVREISGGLLLLAGVLIAEIGPYLATKLPWKNIVEQETA